ncbi:hypothetical protein WCX72_09975 [Sulfurimonas sp. HSL1-6]|uniref:hypothetical protein n=1 Tax=Thiomicrolovo immobilis TaxID=3131935 RepID=UPI0031F92974
MLSKKEILEKLKPQVVAHRIDALDADISIRRMPMSERIEIEEAFLETIDGEEGKKKVLPKDFQRLQATIAVIAMVDDAGEQLFDSVDELYCLAGPVQSIVSEAYMVATGSKEPKKSKAD